MSLSTFIILLLSCSFAASQHVINPAEFPQTTELTMDLYGVIGESTSLKTCISKVASPIDKVMNFGTDVMQIDDKMKKIEQRIEVTVAIMEAVMLIPYVGQIASVVLGPAVSVLNVINNGISKVEPAVRHFAGLMHQWTAPLQTVKDKVDWLEGNIDKFTSVVYKLDAKVAAAEACADSLPVGRSHAIHALEEVSKKLDVIPDGFNKAIGVVNNGCQKVEHVLSKMHVLRRRRGLPGLGAVNHVLDAILKAFGPLGHFLDKIDHVLHKKFCLLHSLADLAKGVIKIGGKVFKEVEHVGKEILKGAKHIIDEAGHVWIEVEEKVEHVIHEIGHVGKEVLKGVGHVGKEVVKGAEHVVHEVGKGVEHVAHEVGKGVEHVAHEVAHGAKHVVHEVSHVVHSIGHAFHHIFGRRSAERFYLIDGKIYVLVDKHVSIRTRRGFDLCISVSDILKGVNFVTGGLMSKAESLISGIFHGHIPFHIPGLTSDVLNIDKLFHNLNFGALLPSARDILKLPKLDIEKVLKLDLQLFEKMLPECASAFSKIKFDF